MNNKNFTELENQIIARSERYIKTILTEIDFKETLNAINSIKKFDDIVDHLALNGHEEIFSIMHCFGKATFDLLKEDITKAEELKPYIFAGDSYLITHYYPLTTIKILTDPELKNIYPIDKLLSMMLNFQIESFSVFDIFNEFHEHFNDEMFYRFLERIEDGFKDLTKYEHRKIYIEKIHSIIEVFYLSTLNNGNALNELNKHKKIKDIFTLKIEEIELRNNLKNF